VLVERDLGGFELKIAVDCKCYKRKVNVNDVERFLGMLDDVRVSKGVLMTNKGYSKTAYQRAQNESRDIELKILATERLSEFQNIGSAMLWRGTVAAVVSPPETWVVDNEVTPTAHCQFSMYPLGHTRDSAIRYGAWLYGNIVLKSEHEPTMEAIAARHENDVIRDISTAKFKHLSTIERESWVGRAPEKTLFRVGHIHQKYRGPEYSLYIDHPDGVLVLVLLCPEGQDETYVPLLRWVGQKALMLDCDQK
jgi:Restriction endonuclease